MLVKYQQLTRRLLNDVTFARCNDFDLRDFINVGRGQIAASGDVIMGYGVLEVGPENQHYPFKHIKFPGDFNVDGIAAPIAIRTILWQVGEHGQKRVNARSWPWFSSYVLAQEHPRRTEPREWSQYGQGASGSIFINKLNHHYRLTIDARVVPVDLVDDDTPEALPFQWTDAVPWFAAFYYMAGQGQNPQAAQALLSGYQTLVQTARAGTTPSVQSFDFAGAPDPYLAGRLGGQGGQAGRQPRQQTPPTAA